MAQQISFYARWYDNAPVVLDVRPNTYVYQVADDLKTAKGITYTYDKLALLVENNGYVNFLCTANDFHSYITNVEGVRQRFYYMVIRARQSEKVIGQPKRVIVKEQGERPKFLPAYDTMTMGQFKQYVVDNLNHRIQGRPASWFNFWTRQGALANNRKSVKTVINDFDVVILASVRVNTASPPNSPIMEFNRYEPTIASFDVDTQGVIGCFISQPDVEEDDESENDESETEANTEAGETDDLPEEQIPIEDILKSNGLELNEATEQNFKTVQVKVLKEKVDVKLTYHYGTATTIGELKQCIGERFNIPLPHFAIQMQGSPLENFDCIDTYVTPDVSGLEMLPKLCGGHRGVRKENVKNVSKTIKAQALKELINKSGKETNVKTLTGVLDAEKLEQQFGSILQMVDAEPVKAFETLISVLDLEKLNVMTETMKGLSGNGDYKLAKIAPHLFDLTHLIDIKTNIESVISTAESVAQLMSNKANESGTFTIGNIKALVEKETLRKEGARDAKASSLQYAPVATVPPADGTDALASQMSQMKVDG